MTLFSHSSSALESQGLTFSLDHSCLGEIDENYRVAVGLVSSPGIVGSLVRASSAAGGCVLGQDTYPLC